MAEHITPEQAALTLVDAGGVTHRLDEAWADRTAVLVFVRHFG